MRGRERDEQPTQEAGGHKVRTVIAGANPDKFTFPYDVPQAVEKGSGTEVALNDALYPQRKGKGHPG